MANELYNNTYEKDITDNILLKTGLDYSEIALLLASQVSNCIKLVLRGQRIWIEQVTPLANDLSNKECFEASISYTYCGRTLVYKAKLNITYSASCVAPILQTITYASGSFTITGQIPNSYLEYSTDGGSSWIRLPTPFADTTSITTSALPTNIDLKVRMVAVCDETKISNVLDYNAITPTFGNISVINTNLIGGEIINISVNNTNINVENGQYPLLLGETLNGYYQTSLSQSQPIQIFTSPSTVPFTVKLTLNEGLPNASYYCNNNELGGYASINLDLSDNPTILIEVYEGTVTCP